MRAPGRARRAGRRRVASRLPLPGSGCEARPGLRGQQAPGQRPQPWRRGSRCGSCAARCVRCWHGSEVGAGAGRGGRGRAEPTVRWLGSLSAFTEGEPGEGREPFELPRFWDALGTGGGAGPAAGGGARRRAALWALGRVCAGPRGGPGWRLRAVASAGGCGAGTRRGSGLRARSPAWAFALALRSGALASAEQRPASNGCRG